ncbi:Dtw domain-containing protein [Thalictrum thalictroides]|uniref:tRNA-uridine aminocarboxypropyltransferase n=1 Tax=Thalictrum thalictroides TaxID=46969 RepID=A0A7J6VPV8_THATH|nr:Dtw domain-containing protein [Thalictrum thalictroides]
METQQNPASTKRPTCPSCSKPILLCLCSRFKTPLFDNSISLTILQHDREKTHPLNSARIAKLGLKNVTIANVSDALLEAKFLINLLKPGSQTGSVVGSESESLKETHFGSNLRKKCVENCQMSNNGSGSVVVEEKNNGNHLLDNDSTGDSELEVSAGTISGSNLRNDCDKLNTPNGFTDNGDDLTSSIMDDLVVEREQEFSDKESRGKYSSSCRNNLLKQNSDQIVEKPIVEDVPDIYAVIEKCGHTCSLMRIRTLNDGLLEPDFDQLLKYKVAQDAITNGFNVRKLHKKRVKGGGVSFEKEDSEEFDIVVPQGTALLFPSENSINIEEVDFDVKHLIVLDGTWAKARRMYYENPWLKLLPHLKLDAKKLSLYSEVRLQPKAGYLSTIESIVCAMKALGDDCEELDNLLDVFESMVFDQRRCKDERISKTCPWG